MDFYFRKQCITRASLTLREFPGLLNLSNKNCVCVIMQAENQDYARCLKYFEERDYGIRKYFHEGFVTIAAFSMLDLLLYICENEQAFLFSPELRQLSANVGVNLPAEAEDIKIWQSEHLQIGRITESIKEARKRYTGKSPVIQLEMLNKKTG
jgi:hypothetical protein